MERSTAVQHAVRLYQVCTAVCTVLLQPAVLVTCDYERLCGLRVRMADFARILLLVFQMARLSAKEQEVYEVQASARDLYRARR